MNPEEEHTYIENYLLGKFSKEEGETLQKRMSEDIRFRESVLLQKQLLEALSEETWSTAENVAVKRLKEYEELYKSQDFVQLKNAIIQAQNAYKNSAPKSNRSWLYYLSAALIAILITLIVLVPQGQTPQELYVDYYTTSDVPSLVARGGEENSTLIDAERYFEEGNYNKALTLLAPAVATAAKNKASILLYKGISEMELGQFEKAHATFDALRQSDLIDAPMGTWYKTLLYLKTEDIVKAKELLKQISNSPSNYKYKEAKELLEKL
ncbi:hypothetical protein [uncultured Dokdonia sp.]|uniref:tetratricopeptide repeat protein n=1 Tax=uncultured Dokdonia sp. TaxID=575653 RepID=UPI002634B5C6|nr:hypothetical protein [uncultured Dokdonia sp.]